MSTNITPDMVGSFTFFYTKPLVRYCVPRIGKQSYRATVDLCDYNLNKFCRILSLSLVVSCCLIADIIFSFQDKYIFRGIWLTLALVHTSKYNFNYHFHFPAQFITYPVNTFGFNFSYIVSPVSNRIRRFLYHNLIRHKIPQAQ